MCNWQKSLVHPSRRRRLQQNPIFPSSCLADECKKERTPPKRVWDQPYALWMPLFNERQQSFHAKNCCCCGLYVRRQRGAPQTISLAGQSFWGWPPRGYDEGELLLLPCIAALPENSHEFEKSWLLFVCVSLFFCSCIDKRWTVLNEICQLRTYYLTIRTDMLVPSSDTSTLLCLPWCSCLKNPATAAPLHECCVIFMQLTEALLKHKRLTHNFWYVILPFCLKILKYNVKGQKYMLRAYIF